MKRCPTCRRDYHDDSLLYCLDDGTLLLEGPSTGGAGGATAAARSASESATQILRAAPPSADENVVSIAVLPLTDLSPDADNEYFCDGLAEELLGALSHIQRLRVAARTSAFSFKGKDIKVDEIARILNVKVVLEGSVRKSGSKLRINVQLVNASDGYQIWSQRYDREMSDIFEVQDEITSAVVDALRIELLGPKRPSPAGETSVDAYDLYLKGRYHLAKGSPPDLQKSVAYFRQALQIDDRYALAYVGLAEAYWRISIAGEQPSREFFPKAKAAAQQAVMIDDRLGAAYVALGWIAFFYDWNWTEAEEHCRHALQLNPNDADAWAVYAHLLSNIGHHSDAIDNIALARSLDPLSLLTWATEGQILLLAGYVDEALTTLVDLIELESTFWLGHLFAARAFIANGMFERSVVEARIAAQYSGGSTIAKAFEAIALAHAGKRAESEALLKDVLRLADTKYVPPYHLALLHKATGNIDEALKYLEEAVEDRDVKMVFLQTEPEWNDIREDARFRDLLKRVGFPTDTSL